MLKPKQSVVVIFCLLLVMVVAYYLTGRNVLACLIGCMAMVLYMMADTFFTVRKQENHGKKRSLIIIGVFGTITTVGLTAVIAAYISGMLQLV